MYIILKRPIISEKSMVLAKSGLYTFEVDKKARKDAILKAAKAQFDVDVMSVKTVNIKGLRKQQRNRKGYYETSATKKAYIQVKPGQKIAIFESMTAPQQDEVVVTSAEGEPIAEVKEKKSLLRGTKVKIEKTALKKGKK
jgi:large subunit ribosomal protein L23